MTISDSKEKKLSKFVRRVWIVIAGGLWASPVGVTCRYYMEISLQRYEILSEGCRAVQGSEVTLRSLGFGHVQSQKQMPFLPAAS